MMPLSFKTATLFPLCAMRPSRLALPLRFEAKLEKTSFYIGQMSARRSKCSRLGSRAAAQDAYIGVDQLVVPRIVVDVNGDAAEGRHFAGELV